MHIRPKNLIFIISLFFLLTACQITPPSPPIADQITATPTPLPITPFPLTWTPTSPPPTATTVPTSTVTPSPTPASLFPTEPLPVSSYPRPVNDNGLGIHWSTHLYAQSDEATSYFVSELNQMNIKWVKLLVDRLTNRDYDHTIDELVKRDIMPIIRIYQQCNDPYDPAELEALVRHYVSKGVYYYDLYNEPNLSGEPGGWCDDGEPQPEYLAEVWAEAAKTIYLAGGYPGLPSFFAPPQKQANWSDDFFYRFFNTLREQGNEAVLYFSWASIHNYNINHPPTYPYDEVNQTGRLLTEDEIKRHQLTPQQVAEINLRRNLAAILKQRPLTLADGAPYGLTEVDINEINQEFEAGNLMGFNLYDDSTAFLHFVAYRNQFYDLFGFDIPLISTEGGATRGSAEDPRYPLVEGETVAEWTMWSANYMLDDAPDYYFATMTWLLAQKALDFPDPTWEINAWYHDREGDQEPVVDALKNRTRRDEVRARCDVIETETRAKVETEEADPWRIQVRVALAREACLAEQITEQLEVNPLENYPRPQNDNGRGIHWIPTNQPLPPETIDYFIDELSQMNIKWVKFLQDDVPMVTDPYLVEQLITNDIEPIMRVFKPLNGPYKHLPSLVTEATSQGIRYFELYNEPNLAGPAGGWAEGEPIQVERVVEWWLAAARDVHAAGGHPSLPPLAGGGTIDDLVFLRQFLDGIKARGQTTQLIGTWLPVHNYMLNHPLDYPIDVVNTTDILLTEAEISERGLTPDQVTAINQARQNAKLPGRDGGFWVGNTIHEDHNSFRKYEAYAQVFYNRFGFYIPLISTEGGASLGSAEDPRYPPVTEADITARTLGAYHYMIDQAPPYFFAHTPWLLANNAGGHPDERFENAAWYKDQAGTTLAVVEALKRDSRKNEVR